MSDNIRPELAHLSTPVTDMQPWPGNPRRGDVADIAQKLEAFGQYQPIIVQRSSGRIVVGNHRYEAATEVLGWTHMAAAVLDIDDVTAQKMLTADNRSSDKSGYDDRALAEFLSGLPDLDSTGWTFDDYDNLLAGLGDAGEAGLAQLEPGTLAGGGLFAGPVPAVLAEVPGTDARYAETPEDEAARAERMAGQTPRSAVGLVEMVIVYSEEDRAEVARLVADCREVLGADVKAGEVFLRALRVMIAVLDNRDDPSPLSMAALCKHAGLWT